MITMFQVNHREDPLPVLFLQHVVMGSKGN